MPDAEALQAWARDELTLLRGLLLICSLGWWCVLRAWLRPSPRAVRAGTLAAWAQLGLGTGLDALCVRAGAWTYRPMALSWQGVPIDLHLDWALLWGFGLVWLADRWPGPVANGRRVLLLLAGMVAGTLAFDVAIRDWMLFLDHAAPRWWLADAAFLAITFSVTLWMHRSVGLADTTRCGLGRLPPLPPLIRGLLVTAPFVVLFFVLLPEWVHDAAAHFGVVSPTPSWRLTAAWLATAGAALLAWGIVCFAREGRGTPVPWDPPRRLVTSGPYARLANPMQTGGVLLCLACAAARPTWVGALYALDVLIIVLVVFRPAEREQLRTTFGAEAERWWADVRAFVPRWRPRQPAPRRSRDGAPRRTSQPATTGDIPS